MVPFSLSEHSAHRSDKLLIIDDPFDLEGVDTKVNLMARRSALETTGEP